MGQLVSKHSLPPSANPVGRSPTPIPAQATIDNAQSSASCSNSTVKPDSTTIARGRRSSAAATRAVTTVIRAIDERNVRKLKKALHRYGCRGWSELMKQYDSVTSVSGGPPSSTTSANTVVQTASSTAETQQQQQPQQATSLPTQSNSSPSQPMTRTPSLLEYAVEKNFVAGVELLIQVFHVINSTRRRLVICIKYRSLSLGVIV